MKMSLKCFMFIKFQLKVKLNFKVKVKRSNLVKYKCYESTQSLDRFDFNLFFIQAKQSIHQVIKTESEL